MKNEFPTRDHKERYLAGLARERGYLEHRIVAVRSDVHDPLTEQELVDRIAQVDAERARAELASYGEVGRGEVE